MNKLAVVVICSLAALSTAEPIRKQSRADLAFDYCLASSTDYLGPVTIDVTPYPVHVATGTSLTITANVDLVKAIEVGSKVSLKLKKIGIIDLDIPCLTIGDLPVPLGSCEYDIDLLLSLIELCPNHCPAGQANNLPLNPGHYGGNGILLEFDEIPAIVEPFLKGKIDAEARIIDGSGAEVICIHTLLEFE